MCGRYVLCGPPSRYQEHFGVPDWPAFPDRYNIAPSASVPIIRQAPDGRRVADALCWGLVPNWAKDEAIGAKLNNARGETLADKPSFRSAYRRRRCIVPASGFYEWQPIAGQTWKQPWYFTLAGGEPLAMGGLWESWTNPDGEIIRTFCIITVGANELMAPVHDRMPLILRPQDWQDWLAPDTEGGLVEPLIRPAVAESMRAWRVSRRVSKTGDDDAALIAPLEETS